MALKRPKSQKNLKETTSASSMTEECDVFNDGLDNEDCRGILLNCLKNLEKEVKYKGVQSTGTDRHRLKANSRSLIFQNQSNFITDKFDEYEKEREEKIEIIKKFK